jgi:2-polyprenyl-6-hydroxyphenyl methylase / 3-demethylubiquinone-9 3-methyltransferase
MGQFEKFAENWHNPSAEMRLLHQMNELRVPYVLSSINKNMKGIDVGTGGGLVPLALAAHGIQCDGIDIEPKLIEAAQREAQIKSLPIKFVCSSVEDYETSMQYDFITCFEMLEHVDDPKKVIEKMLTWLKPGGFIFISTINRTLPAYIATILVAEYLLKWLPTSTHTYEKFITPEELQSYLDSAIPLDLRGIIYNPLEKSKFFLGSSLAVNYIGVWRKN